MRFLLYTILFLLTSIPAQSQGYQEGSMLLTGDYNLIQKGMKSMNSSRSSSNINLRPLSPTLGIYEFSFASSLNFESLQKEWEELGVQVQRNSLVESRKTPNDEFVASQYALEKIGAFIAWEETTGIVSGDQAPVVAIMDDGFDLEHEDLVDVYTFNPGEIPNNGRDDDDNGYIDDYRGLNLRTGNDFHSVMNHGTSVSGIIGAKADNGIGTSGILWETQIYPISNINSEARIIEASEYLYNLKKKWLDTDGAEGINVVVMNFSAGLNNAFAEDHPAWCAVYDMMGSVGILSIIAATNNNEFIDNRGDMPSLCPSEYMLVVNKSDEEDLWSLSGYSEIHVDLSAPGQSILTSSSNSTYKGFTGTSASAPHVAGAVALLYTTDCLDFNDLVKSNPSQASIVIKNAILQGTDNKSTLSGRSSTGGRLNLFGALRALNVFCSQEQNPLSISKIEKSGDQLTIRYVTNSNDNHYVQLMDVSGRTIYNQSFFPSLFGERIISVPYDNLQTGMFIIAISTEANSVAQKVFLTERE